MKHGGQSRSWLATCHIVIPAQQNRRRGRGRGRETEGRAERREGGGRVLNPTSLQACSWWCVSSNQAAPPEGSVTFPNSVINWAQSIEINIWTCGGQSSLKPPHTASSSLSYALSFCTQRVCSVWQKSSPAEVIPRCMDWMLILTRQDLESRRRQASGHTERCSKLGSWINKNPINYTQHWVH